VIELRRKIELAVAHPVWGPVVIITLAVLLGLVFIHVVFDDAGFVADIGAICFGVVTALAAILGRSLRLGTPLFLVGLVQEERGPPGVTRRSSRPFSPPRTADFVLPLRR
jgi:hypothetical protein